MEHPLAHSLTRTLTHTHSHSQYTYIIISLYGVARMASRISIMLFYFRIFDKTPGRHLRIGVLVFDVLASVGLILFVIFPCRPVSHFWTRWDRENDASGSCIDFYGQAVGIGVTQIVIDVGIILLPMPWIAQLRLGRRKKIMSCFLFSVGLG